MTSTGEIPVDLTLLEPVTLNRGDYNALKAHFTKTEDLKAELQVMKDSLLHLQTRQPLPPVPRNSSVQEILKSLRSVQIVAFSGSEITNTIKNWLYSIESRYKLQDLNPDNPFHAPYVIRHAQNHLTGDAMTWGRVLTRNDTSVLMAQTWEQFKSVLVEKFGPHNEVHAGYEMIDRLAAAGQMGSLKQYNSEMMSARLYCPAMEDPEFIHLYSKGLKIDLRILLSREMAMHPEIPVSTLIAMLERVDAAENDARLNTSTGPRFPVTQNAPVNYVTPMELNMMGVHWDNGPQHNGQQYFQNPSGYGNGQNYYGPPQMAYAPVYESNHQVNRNREPNALLHMAHNNASYAKQEQRTPLPVLDFSHLPLDFRQPYIAGKTEAIRAMRILTNKAGRCPVCRELTLGPNKQAHNLDCIVGKNDKVADRNGGDNRHRGNARGTL